MRKTQPVFASLEMEDWVYEPKRQMAYRSQKSKGGLQRSISPNADTLILGQESLVFAYLSFQHWKCHKSYKPFFPSVLA